MRRQVTNVSEVFLAIALSQNVAIAYRRFKHRQMDAMASRGRR
jgi:hypothetical protein